MKNPDITIRNATESDIADILAMVRELAVFENLETSLVASESDYRDSLFGESPAAEAIVAACPDGLVGYAIFFSTFSTFLGKAGIWLEDIFVRESHRNCGVGRQLLTAVAKIASERNAGRFEWCVLDWNQNAIDFYKRCGANVLDDWRIVRCEGEQIKNLANPNLKTH